MDLRVHIIGAPGSGTTTLGQALSKVLACACFDTDQFYWQNWPHSFEHKNDPETRERLLATSLSGEKNWILSGSVDGWNTQLHQTFTHVIFLYLEKSIRLERLRAREVERWGEAAIAPGGAHHENAFYFLNWASHYDDGTLEGRSLPRHEAWMSKLSCPVLRLDTAAPVAQLAKQAAEYLTHSSA